MGDLMDSVFHRPCSPSLYEPEDRREWLGKGGGEITVLEIGGQRRFGEFCNVPESLHDSVGLREQTTSQIHIIFLARRN